MPDRDRSAPCLIALRDIEKSYEYRGGRTFVLRRVGLDIEPGEFVTIMGPSGAGKSTLLNILGMMDGEFEGSFMFMDQPVQSLKPRKRIELGRDNIGFVFQQFHLLEGLTVAENLDVPLSYRNVKRKEREALVADILDRFNIVAKKDLFPSQLSGGQQQQVAVARAMIAEPNVILADEPTGSLHSSQGHAIMELMSELNRNGTTIIQVTHDVAVAEYGNRIIELRDGWVTSDERRA